MDMSTASDYIAAAGNPANGQVGSQIVAPSITTVSFELLLDRTYELWSGDRSTSNAAHQGVWHDIVVLYQMFGIVDGTDMTNILPMQYRPGFLLLDGKSTVNLGSPTLYGYLSGLNYTLTHWTYDMIPIRATMDVQWSTQPNPKKLTGRSLQATGAGTAAYATPTATSLAEAIGQAVGSNPPTWAR